MPAWDVLGGGFPTEPFYAELRAMGVTPLLPPSVEASRLDTMGKLWRDAGVQEVETRVVNVERTFPNFDEMWTVTTLGSAALVDTINAMTEADRAVLKERVRARLPVDASGRLTCGAFANAVKGTVPV